MKALKAKKILVIVISVLSLGFLSACVRSSISPLAPTFPPSKAVQAPPLAPLDDGGQILKNESFEKRVNYATTRVDVCSQENKSLKCDTLQRYETGNDKTDPVTKYGYVTVRIPYNKKIGETKGMNVTEISADIGWNEFKKNITADDILIYVHGYNTTFNNAAVRCAQLTFDLNYKGVPVFFSWPSDGKMFGVFDYHTDKQRAKENFLPLAQFLIKIAENTDKKIHIVSHSMGGEFKLQMHQQEPG